MKNTSQLLPAVSSYHAPAIKTIRLLSLRSILNGSDEVVNDNSIQEYELEQGEW